MAREKMMRRVVGKWFKRGCETIKRIREGVTVEYVACAFWFVLGVLLLLLGGELAVPGGELRDFLRRFWGETYSVPYTVVQLRSPQTASAIAIAGGFFALQMGVSALERRKQTERVKDAVEELIERTR